MINICKKIICFVVGFLLASTVTAYALNVLASSVSYEVNVKSLVNAATVGAALDELYDYARPKYTIGEVGSYYYYDSLNDLKAKENSNYQNYKGAFLAVTPVWQYNTYDNNYTDYKYSRACVEIGNEYECFKPEITQSEKAKMATFFGTENCSTVNYTYKCTHGNLYCTLKGAEATCGVENIYYCSAYDNSFQSSCYYIDEGGM